MDRGNGAAYAWRMGKDRQIDNTRQCPAKPVTIQAAMRLRRGQKYLRVLSQHMITASATWLTLPLKERAVIILRSYANAVRDARL